MALTIEGEVSHLMSILMSMTIQLFTLCEMLHVVLHWFTVDGVLKYVYMYVLCYR